MKDDFCFKNIAASAKEFLNSDTDGSTLIVELA